MHRGTSTMSSDGDDDRFFESCERLSSAVPIDLAASSGSDEDDNFVDSRLSFSSSISSASFKNFQGLEACTHFNLLDDYNLWMAEPGDIKDRRKRLLQGMGLSSNKDLLKLASAKFVRAMSTKVVDTGQNSETKADSCPAEESKQEPSPDRHVVDWTELHEMVTAASYTPDGQGAIIGSHKGFSRRYTIDDSKLQFKDLIEVPHKKKSQAKKVTGFEFAPWNPDEVLITSADSRIRIFDGSVITHKFRGFRNTSSQISASFSPDGKYVITASEDSNVYIWKREDPKTAGAGKGKTWISSVAHEHFQCKDVSVAIPWPGSIKHEPPLVELHSKRHSKRYIPSSHATSGSPTREDTASATNSRRHLPPLSPLPGKNTLERATSLPDEDLAQSSRIDRDFRIDSGIGVGDSFNSSASSSIRYGDSPSISASGTSPSQYWSSVDGGSKRHGANTVQATAWGLAIVTASLGGDIRVYQNFGLPRKVSRQTNIFKDLT